MLNEDSLKLLIPFKNKLKIKSDTVEMIINRFREVSKQNNIFQKFSELNDIDDKTCIRTTGFTIREFQTIKEYLKDMRNREERSINQALAVYLFWLKTGLDQETLAAYFGIDDRRVVARYCEQIRDGLLKYFVPKNLGTQHLSRQEWINNNTPIVEELFVKNKGEF